MISRQINMYVLGDKQHNYKCAAGEETERPAHILYMETSRHEETMTFTQQAKRQRDAHIHKEPSRLEDTMINVQKTKRQRGVNTHKEPSRHEDTMINVQQAKRQRGRQADMQ